MSLKFEANICASIVTYYPNLENLHTVLNDLVSKVTAIIIVNNSAETTPDIKALLEKLSPDIKTHLIEPGKNIGISAHNLAIEWALQQNSRYLLFLDQDSLPAEDMIEQLVKTDHVLRAEGHQVAAVGPRSVDVRTGESGVFLKFVGLRKKRCACENDKNYCPTDSLMFSGMLVKLDLFKIIGLLDDSMFMDNLDTEWGLRAKSKGWHSFGACKAIIHHRVGDQVTEFLGRKFYIHKPERQYTIFCNRILLYKKNYVPLAWKLNDCLHIIFKIALHLVAIPPRRAHLGNIFRGLRDGFFKKTSCLPNTMEKK